MEEFDITRCVICGKAFTARTGNTFWVADASRELRGVAHLTCQRRRGSGYERIWLNRALLDELRFIIWHYAHADRRLRGVDLYASMLIEEGPPSDAPTDLQARLLAHWSQPGSAVGAALAEAAWRRYRELVAAFRASEAAHAGEASGKAE